jgi:hypothetical protein
MPGTRTRLCQRGHLIPLAWHYPESEFVGIDLSEAQVTIDRKLIQQLGLQNCTLHALEWRCRKAAIDTR